LAGGLTDFDEPEVGSWKGSSCRVEVGDDGPEKTTLVWGFPTDNYQYILKKNPQLNGNKRKEKKYLKVPIILFQQDQ
jgi:hypothetical protein